jgi:hypothetical protein
MGSTSRPDISQALRVAPPDVRLVNWPVRDDAWRAGPTLLAITLIAVVVGWKLASPASGALAAIALAVAGWRIWLPVTWELGYSGVSETVLGRTLRIPWSSIAGWREFPGGALLLPEADPSPLQALRGRFIAWRNHRAELRAILEHYVGQPL